MAVCFLPASGCSRANDGSVYNQSGLQKAERRELRVSEPPSVQQKQGPLGAEEMGAAF